MDLKRENTVRLVSTLPNESSYPSLSPRQRTVFYTLCLLLGIAVQFYAIWNLCGLVINSITFLIICIGGVTIHIFGTTFFASPKKQLETATNTEKLPALIVYVLLVGTTLYLGFVSKVALLTLGFLALQVCAYMWYCFWWSPEAHSFFMETLKKQPISQQEPSRQV